MGEMRKKTSTTKGAVFAEGNSFKKLFFVFVIGSVFGDYYERIINLVGHSWGGEHWFWERRSGVIYGPFSVIYGLGAVIMVLAFVSLPQVIIKKRAAAAGAKAVKPAAAEAKTTKPAAGAKDITKTPLKWWQIWLLGGILGGVLEYILGVLQETFTGTSSWDYSDHWMNIGAKTSPYVMLIWGLICLIFVKFAYPWISKQIEKIPAKIGNIVFWILLAFLAVDIFISFSAVLRMNLRRNEVPSFTPYGQFLDAVYPDARVKAAYPNMVDV